MAPILQVSVCALFMNSYLLKLLLTFHFSPSWIITWESNNIQRKEIEDLYNMSILPEQRLHTCSVKRTMLAVYVNIWCIILSKETIKILVVLMLFLSSPSKHVAAVSIRLHIWWTSPKQIGTEQNTYGCKKIHISQTLPLENN